MAQGERFPTAFYSTNSFFTPYRAALSGKEQREASWAALVKPFPSLAIQFTPNGGDGTGMHGRDAGSQSLQTLSQLMVVVKKSYRRLKESKLITFGTNFNNNLFLATADFPAPPISKTDMALAIKTYENAAELSRSQRSDYNTGQTAVAKGDLLTKLNTQVDYAEQTATTSEQLRAVGLEPVAERPSKAPLPPAPEDAGAKDSGMPLSVIVFCKPVKLATSTATVSYYVYETNETGSEQLGLMISGTNSRKLEFGGLTTGKVYYFYIRAKTSAGFGSPSKVLRWVGR